MVDFFADTFALVALLEGDERYVKIFRSKTLATSALNVLEFYGTMMGRVGHDEARKVSSGLLPMVVSIPPEVALSAGEFRQFMRSHKKDCSYIDAWGYAAASHLGIPFLTGDSAFRNLDNVEFVR